MISVADLAPEGEVGAAEVLGDHRRADQQEHRDDDEALDPADLRAAEHPHPVELGGGADPELRIEEAGLYDGGSGDRGGEQGAR